MRNSKLGQEYTFQIVPGFRRRRDWLRIWLAEIANLRYFVERLWRENFLQVGPFCGITPLSQGLLDA